MTSSATSIRNIAVLAHTGVGKTSLVESMLCNAGLITRKGRVEDGNTTTDYLPEEIKRKVSIQAAFAPLRWQDVQLNIIDTPGYSDFIGEVIGAVSAVETVLILTCAVSGVQVQTEVAWQMSQQASKTAAFYVNKLDRENANFAQTLEQLRAMAGDRVLPLVWPVGTASQWQGIVDILDDTFYPASPQLKDMPSPSKAEADLIQTWRERLTEAVVEIDEELMMRYLDGETITGSEIRAALAKAIQARTIIPVFAGAVTSDATVKYLLDRFVELFPEPNQANEQAPLQAQVFKTVIDPYLGKVHFARIYQGTLKSDTPLFNVSVQKEEKPAPPLKMLGKNQHHLTMAGPGEIIALVKLQHTHTGDTITVKTTPQEPLEPLVFEKPTLAMAIHAASKADEDKLGVSLQRLQEEEPCITITRNLETKETLLTAMGPLHIEVLVERLQRKYATHVTTSWPKIAYRESVRKSAKAEGKHKKQTGGHGQYGHVWLTMEPKHDGEFEFIETIFGGVVPRNYIPAVEKGVRESLQEGILAGYPVTNIKINLSDGSYHPVDSSELAFKLAAHLAFRKCMEMADPYLLEPVMNVEIDIPEKYLGDILGDLNGRRGRVLGSEMINDRQIVQALVPLQELIQFPIQLQASTHGRGKVKSSFHSYQELPPRLAQAVMEAAKK
ncbi:elongation factor G [Heliophilum fasciatum]|uniref:Translation elongation factor 2 (EF-2/EF-G) n=1 Tax=Heliophilum fasciatum TaxID=35700 RepID=A0A4R2RH13_9FIRM|nr:elongation factor G [Heliophilum fasciatum]MCW2278921.1 elongation factor G [Heliophilum fasciatum]TCP62054.1 translation elongation factor 2 (EF-2/EF-G) [Heliophilum fasciatum]